MTDFVLPKIFLVLRTKSSVLGLTSSSPNEIRGLQRTRTNNHVLLVRPQNLHKYCQNHTLARPGVLIGKPPYYVWDGPTPGWATHPMRKGLARGPP
jgi:hypothetical protein